MKRAVIPLALVAVVALSMWARQKFSASESKIATSAEVTTAPQKSNSTNTLGVTQADVDKLIISPAGKPEDLAKQQTRPTDAKASLNEMSSLLVDAVKGSKNFDRLVHRLRQTGQNPVLTKNDNGVTGEMVTVRTQSPLPGTRYFHAQYFTDEKNQRFVQHMSFEFKPGPTSMNDAVRAAVQNFAVGEPTDRRGDFVQWELDDNYVLWIKKKSAQDLKNDAFNAHDPATDAGTVQMAVELKVHDDETERHGH